MGDDFGAPYRPGSFKPIAPLGPISDEELARMAEAAKYWQRPETILLLEMRAEYERQRALTAQRGLSPAQMEQLQLAKLSPRDVQQLLNRKRASGLSPRTVQYLRAILRASLTQALKWGLVARNVATLVGLPKVARHEPEVFTPVEARAFLDIVKGDRLEALFTVALACGLRRGEALGLRWRDVDLEAGILSVRSAWVVVGIRPRLEELKTEKGGSRR